jgi:surfeit locus 1 family protein
MSSMLGIALRPKWIAALLLALAIATGFAALGQWQLSRSIESGALPQVETEQAVPLESVANPNGPLRTDAVGQVVDATVTFVPGDSIVLVDRLIQTDRGSWVVAHAVTSGGESIAVALGWAEDEDAASAALREFESSIADSPGPVLLAGRLVPSESPQESDFEAGRHTALSVAELINLWADAPAGVYGGYIISNDPPPGLQQIPSPPPEQEVSLNLLNLFYAAEWVIFAGFAVFLWWRLVRDEWEKEHPDLVVRKPTPFGASVD